MDYFPQLPIISYPSLTSTERSSNFTLLTNILTRSAFLQDITKNTAVFYEYNVKEGETPELIADKLYGDPKRFWIVLLFNKLNNPLYDFPLTSLELDSYITAKYNVSLTTTQTTIHHYEQRETIQTFFNGVIQNTTTQNITISELQQNPLTGIAETRVALPGTADTSLDGSSTTLTFSNGISVVTSTVYYAISTYSYEYEENEKKRKISLLDKKYVGAVESEFKRLMNGS